MYGILGYDLSPKSRVESSPSMGRDNVEVDEGLIHDLGFDDKLSHVQVASMMDFGEKEGWLCRRWFYEGQ